jgi:gamma-glutamylcyclotransferase (GGCT)/AIG2-like uncharacterized protein YtfP
VKTAERNSREIVAVYGTLKRAGSNHHILRGARFLGKDMLKGIRLYDLGAFPGAVPGTSSGIEVEVYEVSPRQLDLIDKLEDYCAEAPETGLYTRRLYPTGHGDAWVYLFQGNTLGCPLIMRGGWSGR